MDFSFKEIDTELFQIEKHYFNPKTGNGSDVSGPYWMLMEITVLRGQLWWNSDGQKKSLAESCFYLFVPPYSWSTEHYSAQSELKMRGLTSRQPLSFKTFDVPTLFLSEKPFPKKWQGLKALLSGSSNCVAVPLCGKPSALSLRAKEILDREYSSGIEIQELAQRLKTSSAVLSRAFKKDFGHPLAFYRKGLRVTVGVYELMMGVPPVEAAQRAGYQDLSRFYKQFKEYMKQTPAEYLDKSKNAKKWL